MAAIVTSSIEISRGPNEVFSYVADRSHDPEWIDSVVSAHREGAGPLAVGSKLQATRRVGPRTVRYTEEMLELDPPRSWANRGYGGLPVTVLAKGRVEPLADGKQSRLTISTQFQGHGIGKLLVRLLTRRLTSQLPRDQQKLRQLLQQATQAQTSRLRSQPMENLFKFLHILAVIVWVGGVLTVNVLQVLAGRGHDGAAQASLLHLSDLYGRAVIAPAAALTLLTGLVRVEQIDVGYGTFWVAWGIAAIVLSLALGATLIRVTNAELRRIAADGPADDQRWPTLQRRATTLFAINLLLLLSAVWAMEFKPTL